MFNNCLSEQAL